MYRDATLIFGIVLPALLCAGVGGLAIYAKGSVHESLARKQGSYKSFDANRRNELQLESQVGKKLEDLNRWTAPLDKETSTAFTSTLSQIASGIPSAEFQQTTFEVVHIKAGLIAPCAQNSSQVRLSTRGTFSTTQKVLLKLETLMPQLQLEEIKIDPNNTSGSALNFQLTYGAWEK